ncbi:MAG: glycosyltransferase family 4 protein [Treponema sp.]|nr:glycosyltransferase family 4 protein [Treponema sp.]
MNKKKAKILINGDFLCRRLTGIERYASEITIRLDKLISPGEAAIIIPSFLKNIPEYKNLEILRIKKISKSNLLYQFVTLQFFLLFHRQYTIMDFGNTCLPLAPGIVFLHDIYCEFFPKDFITARDKFIRLYSRIQYRLTIFFARKIITVSEYSKNEISRIFKIDPLKIDVIYNSADHMRSINADFSVFDDFPVLNEKPFFFSLGSLSRRKNIKWIIEYAEKNPERIFAVSGVSLSVLKPDELEGELPGNIIFAGYLNDSKIKALMIKCRAFIMPSYYEGFGLTPLEALSCGAKIIVSKAASLPEIYGNTACYIDPFDTNTDLDELLKQPVDSPDEILKKYSYDTAVQEVYNIISGK